MDREFLSTEQVLPTTSMHDILRKLDLKQRENVEYVDLTRSEVAPPPFGYLIGENQFAVGNPELHEDGRFLYTKGLLHCTALAINDLNENKALLAHIAASSGMKNLVEGYIEKFSDPTDLKISIIPGFMHTENSITRIQEIISTVVELDPKKILIDLANGRPGDFRDIMVDVISGRVSQVVDTPFTNPIYQQV